MKKEIVFFLLFFGLLISAQRKSKDIVRSVNIAEIENFLATAHPDDPRRSVLKPKLIALKNASWMNQRPGTKSAVQLQIVQIPKSILQMKNNDESLEFQNLMAENKNVHKEKTVKLLNQLFDNKVDSKEAILLFQNKSDCNMVLHIQGKDFYNLAVPAKGENFIVVKKGEYSLAGNVCDARYSSVKSIKKHTLILVHKPIVQYSNLKMVQPDSQNSF